MQVSYMSEIYQVWKVFYFISRVILIFNSPAKKQREERDLRALHTSE